MTTVPYQRSDRAEKTKASQEPRAIGHFDRTADGPSTFRGPFINIYRDASAGPGIKVSGSRGSILCNAFRSGLIRRISVLVQFSRGRERESRRDLAGLHANPRINFVILTNGKPGIRREIMPPRRTEALLRACGRSRETGRLVPCPFLQSHLAASLSARLTP